MAYCARRAAAAIGFAAGVVLASSSHAAMIDWSLSGGTFDDGSTFSGSFSFDTVSGEITTWNIVTIEGDHVMGGTYAPGADESATATASSVTFVGSAANELLTLTGFAPGTAGTFSPLSGGEQVEGKEGDSIVSRSITGGTISSPTLAGAAPEPASWALFIVGFGATGALLRRRRIQAAA